MNELTIPAFVELYLTEIKPLLKSHGSMHSVLNGFAKQAPVKPLKDLTSPDLHNYRQTRLNAGIKPNTINRELSVISAAINHARRKWGVSMQNPVKYQWLKPDPPRIRYLNQNEAKTLITQADKLRPDLAQFIKLAINTGCRKTELLTLEWTDINIQKRYLLLWPENTKTGKRRVLPLNQSALEALQALKQNNATIWVFTTKGRRTKSLDWLFRKAVKSSGIEDFRIHDLRHTFASWLVSEGVELVKVRDLLGHTSIKMTERYAHLMPNKLLEAVSILDMLGTDS